MAFLGNLNKLISFVNDGIENPEIINFLKKRGMKEGPVKSYDDFRNINPLTKYELSELQQQNPPFAGLMDQKKMEKIYLSPGPIFNPKFVEFYHYRFYKALSKACFYQNDVVFNAFSYNMSPAGDMFDEALRYIRATTIPAGPVSSAKAAEIIAQTAATGFIGTRTFLFNVLDQLGESNSLKKAYLIAEKMTEKDRQVLLSDYGVKAYQGYGTAEIGLIATECIEKKMHPDIDIFLEVLQPGNFEPVAFGETGEAVVTLMNGNLPFVRLATGDLTVASEYVCSCGNETGFIEGIFGRSDSSVKVKGVFIHYWQFEEFLKDNNIRGKLYVETIDDKDAVRLSTDGGNPEDIGQIFVNKFGINVADVFLEKNIDECDIIDNRRRLREK